MKSKNRNMVALRKFMLLLLALPFLASCEVQDDFSYEPSVGPDTGKYDGTAWDYLQNAPESNQLGMMKEAVTLTNMQDLYKKSENRTFIMPRDVAFKNYLKNNKYETLADVPVADLTAILKYHVVKAYYYTADPEFMKKNDPRKYDTEGTDPMLLSHNGNFQVLINETTNQMLTVYISNIRPNNGVIHISSGIATYNPKSN